MKVLIINTFDIQGGAARAAYRLHQSLLNAGVDSQMLVQSRSSDDDTVIKLCNRTKFQKIMGRLRSRLDALPIKCHKNKTKTLFSPAWLPFSEVVEAIETIDPDIVHLHWISGGMLRIEDLRKIKKPIVWSLHDMWAFTGGCHYDEECGKYKSRCGSCPVLRSKRKNDLSRVVFVRKQRTYAKIDGLTVVGLSCWLAECASQSTLFANKRVVNLPNPIDTTQFTPINKARARKELHLPTNKKLILFGAMSATSDPRKGYSELIKALDTLPKTDDIEIVVFGNSPSESSLRCGLTSHYLGYVDDKSLHLLYCAADVMIVPSRQEAFGQTASEAMACGTPVVAFGRTGLLDIIDHKHNGYLAEPFSPVDLAKGILWTLNSTEYAKISQNAREKVLRCFDSKVVAKRYIDLYKSILNDI